MKNRIELDELEKKELFELFSKKKFKKIWKKINGNNITFSKQEVAKIKKYLSDTLFSKEDLNYILLDMDYKENKNIDEKSATNRYFTILFGFLTISFFNKNIIQFITEKLISKAENSTTFYNIVIILWGGICIFLMFYCPISSSIINGKNQKCKFYLKSIIEEILN